MTTDLYNAAERTFHAAGCKPRDITAILSKLQTEFGVTASVAGGMLELKQGDTVFSVGTMLSSYRTKYPREFYGEAGSVNFKDDLAGDTAAKTRFIQEHGYDKWAALPLNAKSAGGQHVTTDQIPHAGMRRAEYLRLTVSEKSKLCGEVGHKGIDAILSRR